MKLDCEKVDAIADATSKLAARFDSVIARRADDWSPEARKAAAEARKGSGGNNEEHRKKHIGFGNEYTKRANAHKAAGRKQEAEENYKLARKSYTIAEQ